MLFSNLVPEQSLIQGDKIISFADSRTPRGRISTQFKGVRIKNEPALELALSDGGMDNVFAWPLWKGTTPDKKGEGRDSATLVFTSEEARDAVVHGLWAATNQLFQLGWGSTVLDARLTLDNLIRLAGSLRPSYELGLLYSSEGYLRRVSVETFIDLNSIPEVANKVWKEHKEDKDFICVYVGVIIPNSSNKPGIAMFTPSVLEACNGEAQKAKTYTLSDFYFDCDNECIVLEELICHSMEEARHCYRNGLDAKSAHVIQRELTMMHDLCVINRAKLYQETKEVTAEMP